MKEMLLLCVITLILLVCYCKELVPIWNFFELNADYFTLIK